MKPDEHESNATNAMTKAKTVPETGSTAGDYWRRYYTPELQAWIREHARAISVESTGVRLHVDVYERPERDAPVFVFNHGGGGYSRMFGVLARELFERGYTVAFPDQRGQGFSQGDRGDFVIDGLVENICDVFVQLRARYAGPMILAGGSIGGALTYMAAAKLLQKRRALVAAGREPETPDSRVAVPNAVVCHNLFDLGRPRDGLGLSRLYRLRKLPGFAALSQGAIAFAARCAPGLRLPFGLLGDFRAMVDGRDAGFYDLWKNDPLPIQRVSLRYLKSIGSTPPVIPFEENELPLLVINPARDCMTPPELTRQNYERLGGPKVYRELPYGHWSVSVEFAREWCGLVDEFIKSNI